MPDLEYEKRFTDLGIVFGVDDAGRGALAGPVSVGAAIIPPDFKHPLINDSKKLSEKKREALYDELSENPDIKWSVSLVESKEVEEVNVLKVDAPEKGVDGNDRIPRLTHPSSHRIGRRKWRTVLTSSSARRG